MITFRITTHVNDDHCVVLILPPEVPTGQAELVVSIAPPPPDNAQLPSGLPDWAESAAESKGIQQTRYPLRGSVIRYEQPTAPVAEDDWEALR